MLLSAKERLWFVCVATIKNMGGDSEDVRLNVAATRRQQANTRLRREIAVHLRVAGWYALIGASVAVAIALTLKPPLWVLAVYAAGVSTGIVVGMWLAGKIARKYY